MMRSCAIGLSLAATLLALGATAVAAEERYEDVVGDAVGDTPDILALTVSEPEGEPTIRFEIEMAPDRVFGSDGETWTDTVFVMLSADGTTDERGILQGGYTIGLHGLFLERHLDAGTFLVTDDDLWWYVVDVDAHDTRLGFTLDRKLIGDPDEFYWQMLMGVERFEDEGGDTEFDRYPDEGQPPAYYEVAAEYDRVHRG